jgi:hypothetical protein
MKNITIGLVFFCFLFSCGVKIQPVLTADVTLDKNENILSSTKNNIKVEVKLAPQSYVFYGMEDAFLIYFVKFENLGNNEISVWPEDFLLVDDKGHQVNIMRVEDVAKIIEQNLFYLIPYPYVGYYSEGTHYYEGRYLYSPSAPHTYPVSPRDLYLDAFPWGNISPSAHVKGKIYFKKRVSEANRITLKAVKKDNDFLFRFVFDVK